MTRFHGAQEYRLAELKYISADNGAHNNSGKGWCEWRSL
jgi:hypothetical protein